MATATEEITREGLIALCEAAIVPQAKWYNRDSAGAQRQLGEVWALLRAGCSFRVLREGPRGLDTNDDTIWIEIESEGFAYHDYGGGDLDSETYYIPTRKRLENNSGSDWY